MYENEFFSSVSLIHHLNFASFVQAYKNKQRSETGNEVQKATWGMCHYTCKCFVGIVCNLYKIGHLLWVF